MGEIVDAAVAALEPAGDRSWSLDGTWDLFSGDHKAMDVLKWKDIIDEAESSMDRLEDVANILERIALKHH